MARLKTGRPPRDPGTGSFLFVLLLPLFLPPQLPAADWTMACAGSSVEPAAPPFFLSWEFEAEDDLSGAPMMCGGNVRLITANTGVRALGSNGRTAWKRSGAKDGNEWPGIDGRTGELKWVAKLGGRLAGAPVPGRDSVLLATDSGELVLVDTKTGRPRWRRKLDLPLTRPAMDDTLVLVGSGRSAVGLDAISGEEVFRAGLDYPPVFSPALAPDGCYLAFDYGLVALDRSGAMRWRVKSPVPIAVAPVIAGSGVVLCTLGGGLRSLSRGDGKPVWDRLINGDPSAIVSAGSQVLVGTKQGRITALWGSNGARLWSVDTGRAPVDAIASGDGRLCVSSGRKIVQLVPAPEPPESIDRRLVTNGTRLEWAPVAGNGGPVTGYRVWRQEKEAWSEVGRCDSSTTTFVAPVSWDTRAYGVSAAGPDGGEGPMSRPASLDYADRLLRLLTVGPRPFDPNLGELAVEFDLNETVTIAWEIVDAEGRVCLGEKRRTLTPGAARLAWDGRDGQGHGAEPGIYLVRLRAIRDKQEESYVRGFAVVDSSGASWCPAVIPSLFSVGNRTE